MGTPLTPDFPEMVELQRLIEDGAPHLEVRTVCEVGVGRHRFPVYRLALGNSDPALPVVGFFGGIHGLERIGTQVVLVFLGSLLARLSWDSLLQRELESVRLVFMPLVNPGGMWQATRCNPNGVDLMRNAPIDATERVPPLLGGHRLSPRLPWYRGPSGAAFEAEAQAVCDIVGEELTSRSFSIALDCHSGFGVRDRIWFPFAHTALPFHHLPEVHALQQLFDQTYPHHNYLFEPQSRLYLTHGDLWDHLYLGSAAADRVFLPLTLEMGSWLWVKKNPRQLLSRRGIFNPLPLHRLHRVLRRHLLWLEFLVRAAAGWRLWLPVGAQRLAHHQQAIARWYWSRRG